MPLRQWADQFIRAAALLIVVAGGCAHAASVVWTVLGPGGTGDADAMVACGSATQGKSAVAVGPDGSVVAVGCGFNGRNLDFLTVKYEPDGSVRWSARYNAPSDGDDRAYAVALDQAGDVIVAGAGDADNGSDFTAIKYDGASGATRWIGRFVEPSPRTDAPSAIAVDAYGDVVVTGSLFAPTSHSATVKFAGSDGTLQWAVVFEGISSFAGETASGVVVDAAGDVYVAGTSHGDFVTAKLARADGAQRWLSRYVGPAGTDEASAITLDAKGDVLVTGASAGIGSGFDFATVKYSGASGAQQWASRYAGPANLRDYALSIAVDASGNPTVTGFSDGGTSLDFATVKYDGVSGIEQWVARHDGPVQADDRPNTIVTAANGDVVVAGSSQGRGIGTDYAVLRYAGTTGEALWMSRHDGPAHGGAAALSLALDTLGDVVVGGYVQDDGERDFGIVKLAGTDGAPIWFASEPAGPDLQTSLGCSELGRKQSLAVDASGNAVAVGCAYNGTGVDYHIVKFSPSGSVLWSTGHGWPGTAYAVAIDAVGDVIVTGMSQGTGIFDFRTVKYAGSTGEPLWTGRYDGGDQFAPAVLTIASNGDVLVSGQSTDKSGTRATTVRYAGETGAQLWVRRLAEPYAYYEYATDMSMDPAGDLLVTGSADGDYVTIKMAGASGEILWATRYDGGGSDQANGLAVDADGNALVTGYSSGAGNDLVTVKYDGTSGAESWVRRYDNAGGEDAGNSIAVDAAGDVLVAGTSGWRATTLKYAGTDGLMVWEQHFDDPRFGNSAKDLAVDAAGDVWVTGYSIQTSGVVFATMKLSGRDGSRHWEIRESFGTPGTHFSNAVRIAPDGSIRVAGQVAAAVGGRFGVLRIDDVAGSLFIDGFEQPR